MELFCMLPGRYILKLTKTSTKQHSVETDRNPNFDYRQKPDILLNPKYSANCRIAEYRIVPTFSANLSLFGFGRILCRNSFRSVSSIQKRFISGRPVAKTPFIPPYPKGNSREPPTHSVIHGNITQLNTSMFLAVWISRSSLPKYSRTRRHWTLLMSRTTFSTKIVVLRVSWCLLRRPESKDLQGECGVREPGLG